MPSHAARSAAPSSLRRAMGAVPGARPCPPPDPPRSPPPDRRTITVLAASASLGAAVVHAAVVPEHDDWVPSAAFLVPSPRTS